MKKILWLLVLVVCWYATAFAVDLSLSASIVSNVNRWDSIDYDVTVVSDSTESVWGITVWVDLPVSFIDESSLSITPSDYSIIWNKITWNNQTFSSFESRIYKINWRVSSDATLWLNESTSYALLSSDSELTNNSRIKQIFVSAKWTASVKSNMPWNAPIFEDIVYDVSVINKWSLTLSNLTLWYLWHSSFVVTSITPRQWTYNWSTWTIPELWVWDVATLSVAWYYNTNNISSIRWQLQSLSEQLDNASLTSQLWDELDSAIELEIKPDITWTVGSRSPVSNTWTTNSESSWSVNTWSSTSWSNLSWSTTWTWSSTWSETWKSWWLGSSFFSNLLVAWPSWWGSYWTNATGSSTWGTWVTLTWVKTSTGLVSSWSSAWKWVLVWMSWSVLIWNNGTWLVFSWSTPLDFDWKSLKSKLPIKKVVIATKKVKVCSFVKKWKRYVKVCRWR
jgi:hypothetical protein